MTNPKTHPVHGLLYLLAATCMLFLTGACMKNPYFICHSNYLETITEDTVSRSINRMEEAIEDESSSENKSDLYFQLALLYSHVDNPAPDYQRSAGLFEQYLMLNPNSSKNDEALYIKSLVQRFASVKKHLAEIESQASELRRDNKKLKEANRKLDEENRVLNKAIEELKLLDLRLEERRLNLK